MQLLVRENGVDPRMTAALRCEAFKKLTPAGFEDKHSLLLLSNIGVASKPMEASIVSLIDRVNLNSLGSFEVIDPCEMLLRAIRSASISNVFERELPMPLKYITMLNMRGGKMARTAVDPNNRSSLAKVLGQYLFFGKLQ